MNKKIAWAVGGSCVAVAVIVAIVLTIVFTMPTMEKFESVYADDSKIVATKDCFLEKISTQNWKDKIYTAKIDDFTGVKKIKTVECQENQVIKLNLNIDGGQFKLVLVNQQTKEIYNIANNTINEEIEMQIPAGKYYMKMVGLHAKINLTLDFANLLIV